MGNDWPKPARAVRHLVIMVAVAVSLAVAPGDGKLRAEQTQVPMPPIVLDASATEDAALAEGEMRELWLRHHWTREELRITYKIGDVYQPEALERINWLLRDHRCNKTAAIDPRLLDLLWTLASELRPNGPISVISGYRSEGYNASLLRAGRTVDPNSQHMFGRAVDVIFPGVRLDALRQAAIRHRIGGVGHYPFSGPAFLHLDTGPVRAWEEVSPAQRRLMLVAHRPRTRLQVDCELKMEDVLRAVSLEDAYAALPDGAASDVRRALFVNANVSSAEIDHVASAMLPYGLAASGVFGSPGVTKPGEEMRRCRTGPVAGQVNAAALVSIALQGSEAMAQQVALRSANVAICAQGGPCRIGPRRADLVPALPSYDLRRVALIAQALSARDEDPACTARRVPSPVASAPAPQHKTRALRQRQPRARRLHRTRDMRAPRALRRVGQYRRAYRQR